ncbi:MAG: GreA/GreB family elongation factor [Luteolibacter sp.]
MNAPRFLSETDQARLHTILESSFFPVPTADQRKALEDILANASPAENFDAMSADMIGFHDKVRLESPDDPEDAFEFEIVMPAEADVDQDKISILLPVSLAALGRKRGDIISWEIRDARRVMRIASISKCVEATA